MNRPVSARFWSAAVPCRFGRSTASESGRGLPHSKTLARPSPLAPRPAAFTLVEILITVALLSFIILGLFAVFNQVQRAFQQSMSQVDRLEAGRAVTEMLPRELEQIIPAGYPYPNGVNFYAQIPFSTPLTQPLPGTPPPGTPVPRTNLLEDCFMLLRDNQTWVGIGYCVRTNDASGRLWLPECTPGQMGLGSLYRFYATTNVIMLTGLPYDPSQLYTAFLAACSPGSPASTAISNRICDGVIHFFFRAFDTNGWQIVWPLRYGTDIRHDTSQAPPGLGSQEVWLYKFCSNAVPASVEMELGILDQHTWDRYNAVGTPAARLTYLQREEISGRIQLFRQRIPIRNVDPLAYQ